jgi:hypothetical protein
MIMGGSERRIYLGLYGILLQEPIKIPNLAVKFHHKGHGIEGAIDLHVIENLFRARVKQLHYIPKSRFLLRAFRKPGG